MNPITQQEPKVVNLSDPVVFFREVTITVMSESGATETVTIQRLPRSACPKLALAMDDENAECALYVPGKDAAWAAQLDSESFDAVMHHGQRMNFPALASWVRRQSNKTELFKGQDKLLEIGATMAKVKANIEKGLTP